jgi:hypothetical protein
VSETNLLHENQAPQAVAVHDNRRREERLSVSIPVEITGIDRVGHLFTERTLVEDVTEIGCRFNTRTQMLCGEIVAVKPLEPGKKSMTHEQLQLFEIVWAAHHRAGCTVGARKLQGEKLANVKFPLLNASPLRRSK